MNESDAIANLEAVFSKEEDPLRMRLMMVAVPAMILNTSITLKSAFMVTTLIFSVFILSF